MIQAVTQVATQVATQVVTQIYSFLKKSLALFKDQLKLGGYKFG